MPNKSPLHFVFIQTDQQRFDTIAALGAEHMITPHLDQLTREGIAFTNAYCCGATCIASRAALYTGMYAHNTGCYGFDDWSHHRTWLHELHDHGYHTVAIGKVHHSPGDEKMAFDQRVYVENFPEMLNAGDDYANYLKAEGQPSGCQLLTRDGRWLDRCVSNTFPLDEKYHPDQYVGRMATQWIRDANPEDPFYLHIGFQGPHDPYDPPQRFVDLYKDRQVPKPHVDQGGLVARPPHYARHMEIARCHTLWDQYPGHSVWAVDLNGKTPEQIDRMRKHYYAEITQIDEQVGSIIGALKEKGILENTVILFTSDHGDNLADHELMYKWLMTEQTVRVPMVVRLPHAERGGKRDAELFTQMDIGPTLLDALGLPVPQRLDGCSQWQRIKEGDTTQAPDFVYCEDNYLSMVRSKDRKMILYAGQPYAEYFDMSQDPWEECNLYNDPERRMEILELKEKTLDWLMVSRYRGSIVECNRPNDARTIWPPNHPQDPHVLHKGSIGMKP